MEEKQFHRRLQLVVVLFFGFLCCMVGILYSLQVVKGAEYLEQSTRKIAKMETVEAARGEILDRYGQPMVRNEITYQIRLTLSEMGDRRDETILTLIRLCQEEGIVWTDNLPISQAPPFVYLPQDPDATAQKWYEALCREMKWTQKSNADDMLRQMAESFDLSNGHTPEEERALLGVLYELMLRKKELTWAEYDFAGQVGVDLIARIKELGLEGLEFCPTATRTYCTTVAAHILGRVGQMSEEEWQAYQLLGYNMDDIIGKDGVEKAFEGYLHGVDGIRTLEADQHGTTMNAAYTKEPKPGNHIILTLDLGLQEKTEEVLAKRVAQLPDAEGAAVAILDVNDGGVLAMASYPTFRLSNFSEEYEELKRNSLRPLYNRALQGTYAPGSTFKMVTAIGGLEEGLITPRTQILDTGIYTYYSSPQPQCWIYRQYGRTHGLETVREAITDSCNVFFYDVGRRLGATLLGEYAQKFGLGTGTGIELPGEAIGVVAGPAYTESVGQTWFEGNTLSAAIGQENNRFTPVQLANYVSTLVNGGNLWKVHLLKSAKSSDFLKEAASYQKEVMHTISIEPGNLEAVKQGMLAVTESGSVAKYFEKVPVQVGAKTGSAQVSGHQVSNAVFVCFAPYDNPQIALSIVVEKGGSGSELGAIAADILEYYFTRGGVQERSLTEDGLLP